MIRFDIANWLTVRRVRVHAILLAVGIWTAFFVNLNTPGLRDRAGLVKGADFLHFYTLGTLARQSHGELLYNIPAQTELLGSIVPEAQHYVYVPLYGPQVSLLFYPFAALPYPKALLLWSLLNAGLYGLCCCLVWRVSPDLAGHGLTVLLAAIAFPGFSQLLLWGQTSGLAMLFFTLAYLALRSKQDFLAGLAIGCLIFKPQLGLAGAFVFVATRRWKVVSGAILSASLQLAVAWLRYGTAAMRDYLSAMVHVGRVMTLLEPRPYQTHSLRSFWTMLVPWPNMSFAFYLACALVVLFLVVRIWQKEFALQLQFAALLVGSVLVSPHLTVYDLVILAPAFLLITDWTLANAGEKTSHHLQILIYSCFLLFLLGPIVKVVHIQFSVIAMTAMVMLISRRTSLISSDTATLTTP
jgi:hypothetical protein